MNWKECERKVVSPNVRHYFNIYLERPRKTTKISVKTVVVPAEVRSEPFRIQVTAVTA
jgi:hypothetical protein